MTITTIATDTNGDLVAVTGIDVETLSQAELVYHDQQQVVLRFPNGYGASIINDGYGRHSGLVEVAVVWFDGKNDWELADAPTGWGDTVLGWLDPKGLDDALRQVAALPDPTVQLTQGSPALPSHEVKED